MVSITLNGRLGNQFMQIAFLLSYAKKHNIDYFIPNVAYHCDGNETYFPHLTNSQVLGMPVKYEPTENGKPVFAEIPKMEGIKFEGYFQTFKHFDWCRDYILEKFALPYQLNKGVVGVHIRRGDFLELKEKHPPLPIEYYYVAIGQMYDLGYKKFMFFSDDIDWVKKAFHQPKELKFTYSAGKTPFQDFIEFSCCEHQILCHSTFGYTAAWVNQNVDKIVFVPPTRYVFGGAHADFIPEYYRQTYFEQVNFKGYTHLF